MDLNRYKIFLSVADSGSFTAAAAAWNYTPSGVVHLINALEQEFGFPLFAARRPPDDGRRAARRAAA